MYEFYPEDEDFASAAGRSVKPPSFLCLCSAQGRSSRLWACLSAQEGVGCFITRTQKLKQSKPIRHSGALYFRECKIAMPVSALHDFGHFRSTDLAGYRSALLAFSLLALFLTLCKSQVKQWNKGIILNSWGSTGGRIDQVLPVDCACSQRWAENTKVV